MKLITSILGGALSACMLVACNSGAEVTDVYPPAALSTLPAGGVYTGALTPISPLQVESSLGSVVAKIAPDGDLRLIFSYVEGSQSVGYAEAKLSLNDTNCLNAAAMMPDGQSGSITLSECSESGNSLNATFNASDNNSGKVSLKLVQQ